MLVVDIERGRDALGDHAGAKAAWRLLGHPPLEDELDLIGTAEVEVLANDLVEEDPTGHGPVEHLREAELGLQDRELVAVAGAAIAGRKGMRQARQPLPQQGLDLGRRQPIGQRLQLPGGRTGQNAVVERLVGQPPLRELTLEVLVPVETELGVVREVGAELQEERAEVPIDAIEVVMVHHGRGAHQPGIGLTGLGVPASLSPADRRLLLGLADEQDALLASEPSQVLGHHRVLALTFLEGDQRHRLLRHEPVDRPHERLAHRGHEGRGRKQLAPVRTEEVRHPAFILEPGNIHVEVHPVDALDLERPVWSRRISPTVRGRLMAGSGRWGSLVDLLPARRAHERGRCLDRIPLSHGRGPSRVHSRAQSHGDRHLVGPRLSLVRF